MKNILTFAAFMAPVIHESQITVITPTALETGLDIVKGLVDRGFTPKAAAAIAGNMWQESKFNPAVSPRTASYIGLVQWGGGRKTKLLQKPSWNGLEAQLDFVKQEFDSIPSFKSILTSLENLDITKAAEMVARKYEGSSDPSHPNRLSAAQKLLNAYEAGEQTLDLTAEN